MDGGGDAMVAPTSKVTVTAEDVPKMRDWFMKLVVASRGVLFQNAHIQVGCEHKYRAADARVTLVIGNFQDAILREFSVSVPETKELKVRVAEVPSSVGKKCQACAAPACAGGPHAFVPLLPRKPVLCSWGF